MQFIKNIFKSNHHKAQSNLQQKSYNPYLTMPTGFGTSQWTNCDYHASSKNGYMTNPIMHSCIRMVADGASRVPIKLMHNHKHIIDHELLTLLKLPSSTLNGRTFRNNLFHHLLLSGNAYIHFVDNFNQTFPKALFLLRPDRMTCVTDCDGTITHYQYSTGKNKKRYHKDQILHLKLFSPNDDYYGTAPTQAAWRAICLHNEAMTFQKSLLDNAARPSGCLIYSGLPGSPNLTETQFMRLKSELQQNYTGAAAAGRPMVLEGGLDWKSMSLSPNDMGINALRHDAAREIALAFGVPPMLLGIPGDNTYSNYQEAIRVFTRNTLIPMAEIFYDCLSHKISTLYHENFSFEINRKEISNIFIDYLK